MSKKFKISIQTFGLLALLCTLMLWNRQIYSISFGVEANGNLCGYE